MVSLMWWALSNQSKAQINLKTDLSPIRQDSFKSNGFPTESLAFFSPAFRLKLEHHLFLTP
jgi:hypothetical protein